MEKYICIHGHFYQPPRENAWLEEIELQDSAYPYHDWNERITAECYGPNSHARILNEHDKIVNIVNNYEKISFNFGPTLLSWMEDHAPDTYKAILDADKKSLKHFKGHGSAIAQAYNHMIMPLANRRDKETQVIWGIKDFEKRFRRFPEGMWLPETAVDTETLEILAEQGIKYTILAPRQASKIRSLSGGNWKDVSNSNIDPRMPYLCKLPNGKEITLFIYDGMVSQEVAFNNLLADGKRLSERMLQALDYDNDDPQLVHIATDGESYGHHHRHGEMALSYAINYIEENPDAHIINYGGYLEKYPPTHEIQIFEDSSWSCIHGVERWRNDCGCSTGGHSDWNQKWRAPLRNALDWLQEKLITVYEENMPAFYEDVWKLRNDYIEVILDRSEKKVNEFIKNHLGRELKGEEKTKFIRLIEMQRHAMLMYTSCAWFFDEVSGIETTQVMQYANRAIQLAERENEVELDSYFRELLKKAPSNYPEVKNAEQAYNNYVEPTRLTLSRVGMHYAVHSLFAEQPESLAILNYKAESKFFDRIEAGLQRLAVGKTKVNSKITYSEKSYVFAVIYLGQHLLIGSVNDKMDDESFDQMYEELKHAFINTSIAQVMGVMQNYFGPEKFSLRQLFKDEQRKVVKQIIQRDVEMAEDSYKKIYDRNYNIMNFMYNANIPLPRLLRENLEMVINIELRSYFSSSTLSSLRLKALVQEVKKWDVFLYEKEISYFASNRIYRQMLRLAAEPYNHDLLKRLRRILGYLKELEIDLDLYKIQNVFYSITKEYYEEMKNKAKDNDEDAKVLKEFKEIAQMINMAVEEI